MIKKLLVLLGLVLLVVVLFAGCGNNNEPEMPGENNMPENMENQMGPENMENQSTQQEQSEQSQSSSSQRVFTVSELAQYNGQNGQPAYVAVDGVVYNVTGQPDWPDGEHTPCGMDAMAGQDLSQVIEQAPANMRTLLQQMPVVGTLQQ